MNEKQELENLQHFKIPRLLAERIVRLSEAKRAAIRRGETMEDQHPTSYREWDNAGYSIYNDRG